MIPHQSVYRNEFVNLIPDRVLVAVTVEAVVDLIHHVQEVDHTRETDEDERVSYLITLSTSDFY